MIIIMAAFFVCQNFQPNNDNGLLNSIWDTRYQDSQGGIQDAIVTINGDKGEYKLINTNFKGSLFNIKYFEMVNHEVGPPTPAIVGNWKLGNQIGYFVFREPDTTGFTDGYWGKYVDNQPTRILGSWDGRLLASKKTPAKSIIPQLIPSKPNPPIWKRSLVEGERGLVPLDQLPHPERQIGLNGNISLESLQKGYKLAESVGRIVFQKRGFYTTKDEAGNTVSIEAQANQGAGTCFMIGNGYVMTAKHVIEPVQDSSKLVFRFPKLGSREIDQVTIREFQIDGLPLLFDPDIAVFKLKSDGSDWPKGFRLTSGIDPNSGETRFAKGEEVFILHYPENEGFSFSIKGLKTIVNADEDCLAYTLSTEPGSSGAPVVNPNWELLAVHWGDGGANQNIGFRTDLIVKILRQKLSERVGGTVILREIGLQ